MEDSDKENAGIFFNKLLNELDSWFTKRSFADFLKKKASEPASKKEKKEIVYGGIVFNTILAVNYILKIKNNKKSLNKIRSIIKKLEEKKSQTDNILSSVIQFIIKSSDNESCFFVFTTECFLSFLYLLEIETKVKLEGAVRGMISSAFTSFLNKNIANIANAFVIKLEEDIHPGDEYLKRNSAMN